MSNNQRRNPFVAGVFSVFVTGLGQFYNGQLKKAICFFLLSMSLILFCYYSAINWYFGFLFGRVCLIVLLVIAVVDAIVVALKIKEYQTKAINKWYYYLIAIVLVTCGLYSWLMLNVPVKGFIVIVGSMEPNFEENDKLMVSNEPCYHPRRGEVILFEAPGNAGHYGCKRVLALSGEKLIFKNSRVYINGEEIFNTWKIAPGKFSKAYTLFDKEYQIPKNTVFVIGDNVDASLDSREFGPVSIEKIKGKVLYIYDSKDKSKIGKKI